MNEMILLSGKDFVRIFDECSFAKWFSNRGLDRCSASLNVAVFQEIFTETLGFKYADLEDSVAPSN